MKKLSFLLVTLLFAGVAFAQNVAISFDKTSHDFGKIKEQDGLATITFTVKNTGTEPLVISRVQASCGCTTPTWTKDPILPGKTGTITASYNPANRPGTFVKTISVFSNAGADAKILTIKGEVIPKPAVAP
jgi:archaellum component FlaG (FlaF/FlaG flagellin family)